MQVTHANVTTRHISGLFITLLVLCISTLVWLFVSNLACAWQVQHDSGHGHLNWELQTLGGKQFWTDVRFEGGWHIQRNSETGHFRLLDANGVRKAWGSFKDCESELDQQITTGTITPYSGKVVVLLHGLVRSNSSMRPMAGHLRKHGYQTINFGYASSRHDVATHARDLREVIESLNPNVTEINFVCHSLGNIVVRRYLFGQQETPPQTVDGRIGKMVMLGPPNQGSRMARLLKNSIAFRVVAGVSGSQLSSGWNQLQPQLATPSFPFGIIAGGQGDDAWVTNPLLAGEDDFTVSVAETKLSGAADLYVTPLLHGTMMADQKAFDATLRFLEHGYFISANQQSPIP